MPRGAFTLVWRSTGQRSNCAGSARNLMGSATSRWKINPNPTRVNALGDCPSQGSPVNKANRN